MRGKCRHCGCSKDEHETDTNGLEPCTKCDCGEFW